MTYRITAQAYTSSHRITRIVEAASGRVALRMVASELEDAGFYVTSIEATM